MGVVSQAHYLSCGAGGNPASLNDIRICASAEKEGVSALGDTAPFVELVRAGQMYPHLNVGTVHLYLCKNTAQQLDAVSTVDQVSFSVSTLVETAGAFTAGPTALENYPPFEMMSTDQLGGAGIKKVTAVIKTKSGQQITLETFLDLRGNGNRWRFRRHLQPACPTGGL